MRRLADLVLGDHPAEFSLHATDQAFHTAGTPQHQHFQQFAANLKIAVGNRIEDHPGGRAIGLRCGWHDLQIVTQNRKRGIFLLGVF